MYNLRRLVDRGLLNCVLAACADSTTARTQHRPLWTAVATKRGGGKAVRSVERFHDLRGVLEMFCRFRGAKVCRWCIDESTIASVRLTGTVLLECLLRANGDGSEIASMYCIGDPAFSRTSADRRPLCVH